MTKQRTIDEWLSLAYAASDACPPPELFLAAEWEALDEAGRRSAMRHVESCPACAAERELALAFDAPPLAGPDAQGDLERILERVGGHPADGDRDGARLLRFPFLSRLTPRGALAVAAAAMVLVAAAVVVRSRAGAPALPSAPADDVMRGGRVILESPIGDVETIPSALVWRGVEGADSYRVTLSAVDDTVLWSGTVVRPPAALPTAVRAALAARVVYSWRVEAFDGDGGRIAASEPARFRALAAIHDTTGGPSRP